MDNYLIYAGVALAIIFVAAISATSIDVLLASSLAAFTVVKIIGAVYLMYLGIKMFRSKGLVPQSSKLHFPVYPFGWNILHSCSQSTYRICHVCFSCQKKAFLRKGISLLGKISGSVFVFFGVGLAATSR